VRQAFERFGLGRTLAFGLGRHGWGGQAWLGLSEMQHDEEPYDRQQSELVVKKMRDHGLAPSKVWGDGAFSRVFGPIELSRVERYTTRARGLPNGPPKACTSLPAPGRKAGRCLPRTTSRWTSSTARPPVPTARPCRWSQARTPSFRPVPVMRVRCARSVPKPGSGKAGV